MTVLLAGPAAVDAGLKQALHRRLLADPRDVEDRAALRVRLDRLLHEAAPLIDAAHAARLLDELVVEVDGFGPLEPLLCDAAVSEVMLNGPYCAYVERAGRLDEVDLGLDSDAIVRLAQRAIAPLGLRLDRAAPIVDARLPDGSRLHAVLPPLAPDGPCLTIRRFAALPLGVADFGAGPAAADLLALAVQQGRNVLVAGGTGAGKTTLLNALSQAIDPGERIVTIEETAELRLRQPHVVRLEARPANAEGAGGVSVRELVRASLRMRPDRIVVGEVRGGEALDMLQALNTGHDGSLSTLHANGPDEALARLETLTLMAGVGLPLPAVRSQIAGAVDLVVFVARDRAGRRIIVTVAEVVATRGGRAPSARPLLVRDGAGLRAVESPRRAARTRGDAGAGDAFEEAWSRC